MWISMPLSMSLANTSLWAEEIKQVNYLNNNTCAHCFIKHVMHCMLCIYCIYGGYS